MYKKLPEWSIYAPKFLLKTVSELIYPLAVKPFVIFSWYLKCFLN